MASLSSKRKAFTNRQLKQRDTRARTSVKVTTATIVAVQPDAAPAGAPAGASAGASVFDAAVYSAALARFETAASACGSGDVKQMMRALVQQEFDAGGREAALQMRPYIIKYVGEQRGRLAGVQ